jgi:hypothetical protein
MLKMDMSTGVLAGTFFNDSMNRRSFLAAAALAPFAGVLAADTPTRIRIGQIGTSHAHASVKMAAIRSLTDDFELVGIADADPRPSAESRKARILCGAEVADGGRTDNRNHPERTFETLFRSYESASIRPSF